MSAVPQSTAPNPPVISSQKRKTPASSNTRSITHKDLLKKQKQQDVSWGKIAAVILTLATATVLAIAAIKKGWFFKKPPAVTPGGSNNLRNIGIGGAVAAAVTAAATLARRVMGRAAVVTEEVINEVHLPTKTHLPQTGKVTKQLSSTAEEAAHQPPIPTRIPATSNQGQVFVNNWVDPVSSAAGEEAVTHTPPTTPGNLPERQVPRDNWGNLGESNSSKPAETVAQEVKSHTPATPPVQDRTSGVSSNTAVPKTENHFKAGVKAHNSGKLEEALTHYNKELESNPNCVATHYNKGNVLYDLKRDEEALISYNEAIKRDPNHVNAHCNKGNVLSRLKREEEALISYDNSLALNPDHLTYYNKGNSLLNLNRYEEAITSYEEALKIDPNNANVLKNKALAEQALAKKAETK